ncbi:fungal specific transcription factor domain-containing protein [Aspergillus melleus]|uniref:fungal specific transcription factor domain-containing protein n=1 Tax=Aspergillus melleus TaxID=138277 RepID=UPI001E8D48E2|nr:uncharacterized protein LDX57_005465 [Aspergillus melleus]KAH8427758.1 hypothetical protein LDX57_005465 [Aspergillus melleus]
MCVESATAIARLLHLYEKHYTFRRMNNQVVAMIFSAALMLLYVTISNSSPSSRNSGDSSSSNAGMVAYLNLCFRALDELGQSFENAKRTRDFLVSLQRRWQAHMRRSGAKRQVSRQPSSQQLAGSSSEANTSRKKTRIAAPREHVSYPFPMPVNSLQAPGPLLPNQTDPLRAAAPLDPSRQPGACQPGEFDWIRNSDLQLLSGALDNPGLGQLGGANAFGDDPTMPSLSDIEPWWDSPPGNGLGNGSL